MTFYPHAGCHVSFLPIFASLLNGTQMSNRHEFKFASITHKHLRALSCSSFGGSSVVFRMVIILTVFLYIKDTLLYVI